MKDLKDYTFVVAHAVTGTVLIGWVQEEEWGDFDMGDSLTMVDVRTLTVHLEVDPASKQLMRGAIIGHVDMFSGPVPILDMIPCIAYAPDGEDEKRLLAMIEVAKDTEETASAREAGLFVPNKRLDS